MTMAPDILDIRKVKNAAWSQGAVHDQYSYRNSHSDLYLYINQWSDMETYLNVGYTRWWQRHSSTSNHLRLIDRLADALLALHWNSPHRHDRRLLDVASGRGGAAIRAFQEYGVKVTGVDFTEYNVRRAAANARKQGVWSDVDFQMGDAHNLPIADEAVSLAWSIESPAHFKDKPQFLSEINRVLKPGGCLAMSELLVVEPVAKASDANKEIYDNFLKVWDVPYLESRESYLHAMQKAGLKVVQVEIATKYNLSIYKRYCQWFLALCKYSSLYASYKRFIREKLNADLDNVREHSLHSYRALNAGMIDYGLFWAVKE